MTFQNNGLPPIEQLPTEKLYEEIAQYLKTSRSYYFQFEPREPIDEAVLRVFESSDNEYFRNKIREALCFFLHRERLFDQKFPLVICILDLVSETYTTQATDFLLELARKNAFPKFTDSCQLQLKSKVLSILMKFPLTQVQLKELIDRNISNPNFSEICLAGAIRLIPQIDMFADYLSKALQIYAFNRSRLRLDRAFIAFLAEIGQDGWRQWGSKIINPKFLN